jgi:hypothetical protein
VKIGIPESWWCNGELHYKQKLSSAIEDGLHSMIALLLRNRHEIQAEQLLNDWSEVKRQFLGTPALPYAAEGQRAALMALVEQAKDELKRRKVAASGES